MAVAAEQVVDLTFWQLCLGVLGLVLVLFTIRQNQGMLKSAIAATEAAAESNRITTQQLIIENRPWLNIKEISAREDSFRAGNFVGVLKFMVENIGNSPALEIQAYGSVREAGSVEIFSDNIKIEDLDLFDAFVEVCMNEYGTRKGHFRSIFPKDHARMSIPISFSLHENHNIEEIPQTLTVDCCVCYSSKVSDQIFRTAFTLNLNRTQSQTDLVNGKRDGWRVVGDDVVTISRTKANSVT
ncbi:MAG: hypothetical protein GC201_14170 [Alphaproteobacteria bacterium]|nr:hypothetical protein [Alphaproteobacteria bacterium]